MIEAPAIIHTSDQHTAIIPMVIPRREMPTVIGPAVKELITAATAQGLTKTGPWFAHHLSLSAENFDFEVSIPVSGPFQATGRAIPSLWPAGPTAHATYHGDYTVLPAVWDEFRHWIDALGNTPDALGNTPDAVGNTPGAAGRKRATHIYEVYTVTPSATVLNPADWTTDLYWPLAD